MKKLTIVKIGGQVIDNPDALLSFLVAFAQLDVAKILVHGGGTIATEIGQRLGIQSHYVEGRRITDESTLELITMVYGGLVNKRIVAQLQALSCNAIGLTGADGNALLAEKRAVDTIDYGFAGDIDQSGVNTAFLAALIDSGLTPVLAPLTHNGKGILLNTNADTIAQKVATALCSNFSTQLIYCFEKEGVLHNSKDECSVIPTINEDLFRELQSEGVINGGMIPKLSNALTAIKAGVASVVVGRADHLYELANAQKGTQIV